MDLQSKHENFTLGFSVEEDHLRENNLHDDTGTLISSEEKHSEGVLTPVHYIVIVLMMYMGGIAILIMKSVQKENELLRYSQYYVNFVKRPQFNRPRLLTNYGLNTELADNGAFEKSASMPQLSTVVEFPLSSKCDDVLRTSPSESVVKYEESGQAQTKIILLTENIDNQKQGR